MSHQYATAADLAVWGIGAAGVEDIDPTVIDKHLIAATATADSYLDNRYPVPLTTVGEDVKSAVCRIAAWRIVTAVRGVNPADPAHVALMKNHDDAIAWLRDVSKTVASLHGATAPAARKNHRVAQVISVDFENGEKSRGW